MAEKKEPAYQSPSTPAPTATPVPAPKQIPVTEYQGKKIVATRPARAGDDGYQLSTIDTQVTIILEDGSEKVVKPSDLVKSE